MSRWIERAGYGVTGVLAGFGGSYILGAAHVSIEGEVAANILGATIGGLIAVGLALGMAHRERAIALRDAAEATEQARARSIVDALRYVRSIRECVFGGRAITINNCQRITETLNQAVVLTRRALDDITLTDFPLRLAMRDAAQIGEHVAATLAYQVQQSGLTDANIVLGAAANTVDPALNTINQLMEDYTELRRQSPL